MKKLNFAILGALLAISLTTRAFADTTIPWTKEGCESVKGTWITAHSPDDDGCDANHCNGLNFCRSPQEMHWFSALVWCKSIGRELADVETVCPNGVASSMTCANLAGLIPPTGHNWYSWTKTPSSNTHVYKHVANNSFIMTYSRTGGEGKALCQ